METVLAGVAFAVLFVAFAVVPSYVRRHHERANDE